MSKQRKNHLIHNNNIHRFPVMSSTIRFERQIPGGDLVQGHSEAPEVNPGRELLLMWCMHQSNSVDVRMLQDNVRMLQDNIRMLQDNVRMLQDNIRMLQDNVRMLQDNVTDVRMLQDNITDVRMLQDNVTDVRMLQDNVRMLQDNVRMLQDNVTFMRTWRDIPCKCNMRK